MNKKISLTVVVLTKINKHGHKCVAHYSYMNNEQINLIVKRYYKIKNLNSLQFRVGHGLKISFN